MADSPAIIGVFQDSSEAEAVTEDLRQSGFGARDVRMISRTEQAMGQAGGAGAAIARAVTERLFEGIAITKEERRHYEDKLSQGRCLVIAKASGDRARQAADIMKRHGTGVKRSPIETQQLTEDADRFGGEFAADQRYAGRDWSGIESDLRQSWEQKHAGTWDEVKDRFQTAWRGRFSK